MSPVDNMSQREKTEPQRASTFFWLILEVAAIVAMFWFYGGQPAPDVNETHYLTKAKHFWNPNWCPGDLFLGSSNPHWLFYVTFGWLTLFLPLGTVAIIGRFITWTVLAIAWQRLSRAVFRTGPRTQMMGFLTATIFLFLLSEFHLAGEWVVGGFEAKGFAYAFVIWALANAVQGKWSWVWVCVGAASAFHVLVGGWSCLCLGFAFLFLQEWKTLNGKWKQQFIWPLMLGGLISLPGLLPPFLMASDVPAETTEFANRINVTQRLNHHQFFHSFRTWRVAVFAMLLLSWGGLNWLLRTSDSQSADSRAIKIFNQFAFASLIISAFGILLSAIAQTDTPRGQTAIDLLVFYWFRLSDFAVPLAMTFGLLTLATRGAKPIRQFAGLLVVTAVVAAMFSFTSRWQDPRPFADQLTMETYEDDTKRTMETFQNWKRACDWIQKNTPDDAVFLTPAKQQTFKWYAHRTEVFNWKDSPQEAAGLVEWYERAQRFHRTQSNYVGGLWAYSDEQLQEIASDYGVNYLMTRQADLEASRRTTRLRQVYPADPSTKATYVVFEF